jgi:hypothetical protein
MFGFLGVGAILMGILISAAVYQGSAGENYSFLNHFVSELGEYANSEMAIFFNLGLILGGVLLLRFMFGLAMYLNNWFGWLMGISGLVICISGSLVGVFSMDNLGPHFQAAFTFFYTGLVVTVLFSAYVLFLNRTNYFDKRLAIPGVFAASAFVIFLFFTEPIVPEDTPLEDFSLIFQNRPNVWETAIFEWVVVLTIIVWVISLSIFFLRMDHSTKKKLN